MWLQSRSARLESPESQRAGSGEPAWLTAPAAGKRLQLLSVWVFLGTARDSPWGEWLKGQRGMGWGGQRESGSREWGRQEENRSQDRSFTALSSHFGRNTLSPLPYALGPRDQPGYRMVGTSQRSDTGRGALWGVEEAAYCCVPPTHSSSSLPALTSCRGPHRSVRLEPGISSSTSGLGGWGSLCVSSWVE